MATNRIRRRWTVAAVQMTSTTDVDRNVGRAAEFVREAAAAGADLIALPENFAYLRAEGREIAFKTELDGELVGSMRDLARETKRHLLLGSIPESVPRSKRVYNTSVLIGPRGDLLGVYRKLHLFDIRIRGKVTLQESRYVKPGDQAVVVKTGLGRLGLSICYDLRFPELYRRLALRGAQVQFLVRAS